MESTSKGKKTNDCVTDYDVSLSEELKRVFPLEKIRQPELIVGISEILDIDDIGNIVEHIVKATSCAWSFAYSSSLHKRTLEGFCARLKYVEAAESPLLLLCRDRSKCIRGAFLLGLHHGNGDDKGSPTGELFYCRPDFRKFQGLTEEPLVVAITEPFLSVVDKTGRCGMWFDSGLVEGHTEEYTLDTETNEGCIVERHFDIKTFECWMISEINRS